MHTWNPNTQEAEERYQIFKASLGYIVSVKLCKVRLDSVKKKKNYKTSQLIKIEIIPFTDEEWTIGIFDCINTGN